jgi:beta-lactamase regulating signal transducer with metallopeptidase domain
MTVPLDALGNHLWQSTLFALVTAVVCVALRRHNASIRHTLWCVASLKFLVPFGVLEGLGTWLPIQPWMAPSTTTDASGVVERFSEPFGIAAEAWSSSAALALNGIDSSVFVAVWMVGFCLVAAMWAARWIALGRVASLAQPLAGDWAFPIRVSAEVIEPGVFGVFRPVVLLPTVIVDELTPAQLDAVIVHEACHIRRRDNLAMTFHMIVEALCWFHPVVWWIERRLVAERERACDEQVLADHRQDAGVYAGTIVRVCELALSPASPCASRMTGVDLQRRIEAIMTSPRAKQLRRWQKAFLVGAGVFGVSAPVAIGARVAAHHESLGLGHVQAASRSSPSTIGRQSGWHGIWRMNMAESSIPDPTGTRIGPNVYVDGFYNIEIAVLDGGLRVSHVSRAGAMAEPLRQDVAVPFDGRPVPDVMVPQRTWSYRSAGATAFDLVRTTAQANGAAQVVAQHYEFADNFRKMTWTWRADNPAPSWRIAALVFDKEER